jgi:tetratricopeptide (TPR) repeat protein
LVRLRETNVLDQKHALTVLTRLAARRAEEEQKLKAALKGRLDSLASVAMGVAIETGDPIGRVLADAFEERAYDELSRTIESQIPLETTALRELALVLIRQRYDKEIYQQPIETEERALYVARNLVLYGHHLQVVGKLSPALNSYLGANRILAELGRNEVTIPILANLLNNIVVVKTDLDPAEDMRELAQESVECHRWAVEHGAGSKLGLADSLNTLACLNIERSSFGEAIGPLQEALKIVEGNFDERGISARAEMARLKNNLGLAYCGLGEAGRAVSTLAESVNLARKLAEANPDFFQMFLARYLGSLAAARLEAHDIGESRRDAEESISIWKGLSARRPDAFADDYLRALDVLARIDQADSRQFAADISERVIRERFAGGAAEPQRWNRWLKRIIRPKIRAAFETGDWATVARLSDQDTSATAAPRAGDEEAAVEAAQAYGVQGIAKRRTGQLSDAIKALTTALDLVATAIMPEAKVMRANLLRQRGWCFADDKRTEQALADFRAANEAYGAVGEKSEQVDTALWVVDFLGDEVPEQTWATEELERAAATLKSEGDNQSQQHLAAIAARLGLVGVRQGRWEKARGALDTCKQCVLAVRSQSPSVEIDAYQPLARVAHILVSKSKLEEALAIRQLALMALGGEAHLADNPAYAERTFDVLTDIAEIYNTKGDSASEIETLSRLLDFWNERTLKFKQPPPPRFARMLDQLALVLKKVNRKEEALSRAREAAAAYEGWFRQQPEEARIDYAGGLNNLSNRLWEVGQRPESLAVIVEALNILEPVIENGDPALKQVLGSLYGSYISRAAELGEELSPAIQDLFMRFARGRARARERESSGDVVGRQ